MELFNLQGCSLKKPRDFCCREQWIENGMPLNEEGRFSKKMLDLFREYQGEPSVEDIEKVVAKEKAKKDLEFPKDNEKKELDFELKYQKSLSLTQRFRMVLQQSKLLLEMLVKNGHRKPFEIVKRNK